jgi:hypothetical protein
LLPDDRLERAGWIVSDDGLRARLPAKRALPAVLLVLAGLGAAMLGFFLVQTGIPQSPIVYVAALGILLTGYAAVRGLNNRTDVAFRDGIFHCEQRWPRERYSIAMSDVDRFEGFGPAHYKDVAHVIVRLTNGRSERLPIIVAEAAPIAGYALARAVADALDTMLDEARRRTGGYRFTASFEEAQAVEHANEPDERTHAVRRGR